MKGLSILIPGYNCDCTQLVRDLHRQCASAQLPSWEIVVADDGSIDETAVNQNRIIGIWDNCTFIRNEQNMGRAAIRNFLAEKAQYDRLLFIDSDMCIVSEDFVKTYLASSAPVIYGGYSIVGNHAGNLRYEYERQAEHSHRASVRQLNCYKDFHTSNFCIDRGIFIAHPLDVSYEGYGYEDVAYGDQLCRAGIPIQHIDNPVGYYDFETNESYMLKVEESLLTLYRHRSQLKDYSRIIAVTAVVERIHLHHLAGTLFRLVQNKMRRQIVTCPRLMLFTLYKIGYYINLTRCQK